MRTPLRRSCLGAKTRGKGHNRPGTISLVQRPTVQVMKLRHEERAVQHRTPSFCWSQAGTAMKAMPRHSGVWEGAPDQKHTYLEGRLPGEHYLRTPQRHGTPKMGRTHSSAREWGQEYQNPASGRKLDPSFSHQVRLLQAHSEQTGTVKSLGPTVQQAAQEK